jgi:acetylornithine aminotransferase
MGNGFPIGGVLISPKFEASFGLLGTTFGGNHLACAAAISVLEIIKKEHLISNATIVSAYFNKEIRKIPQIKNIKGRGLMAGIEFDFEVGELRKKLIYDHHIFTGGAMNKNLIRILPPLTVTKEHIDSFIKALKDILNS